MASYPRHAYGRVTWTSRFHLVVRRLLKLEAFSNRLRRGVDRPLLVLVVVGIGRSGKRADVTILRRGCGGVGSNVAMILTGRLVGAILASVLPTQHAAHLELRGWHVCRFLIFLLVLFFSRCRWGGGITAIRALLSEFGSATFFLTLPLAYSAAAL
eukprot:scaffold32906_cov34-Tisochrysis_lutea.AAC.2